MTQPTSTIQLISNESSINECPLPDTTPTRDAIANHLIDIKTLNDMAVDSWATFHDLNKAEKLVVMALHILHDLCQNQLTSHQDSEYMPTNHGRGILLDTPRTVGGDVKMYFGVSLYNRAFVFGNVSSSSYSEYGWSLENIMLTAAVLYYNSALLFHTRARNTARTTTTRMQMKVARKYYTHASRFLEKYMERTREPLWFLQASLWYNLGTLYRDEALMDRDNQHMASFLLYMEQVSTIANWVPDRQAKGFFTLSNHLRDSIVSGQCAIDSIRVNM